MKNLNAKFQFVKPLYKKVKPHKHFTKHRFVTIDIDNSSELRGHADNINSKVRKLSKNNNFKQQHQKISSDIEIDDRVNRKKINNYVSKCDIKTLSVNSKMFNSAQNARKNGARNLNDVWLRVYPARNERGERLTSILFRVLVCQIGLNVFLAVWTVVWVFVINYFEGPYEQLITGEFKHAQNQLVIDLATELRQITPLSPKWKNSIEQHIEEGRRLTTDAVAKGARFQEGQFWNLAGTFLFAIYVMTALGFGAPVPHTLWGRTSSLIYAIVAVPTHIYLMVHLSTCVVVNVERCLLRMKFYFQRQILKDVDNHVLENKTESPSTSKNSEPLQSNISRLQRKIFCILSIIWTGRGVPITMALYYTLGAICFGLLRNREPLEIVMFPLEFTTTGGLERTEDVVKILYGIYVEGAMILLSCGLACLKRYSSMAVDNMADKYRLFVREASLPRIVK